MTAARRATLFADPVPRRIADAEIRGRRGGGEGEKEATKPIKVQSALIALLIFDLRARARTFVGSFVG